jgi:hypothetical protein
MSDIYLSLTETPSVVTLSQPVVASVMVNTVTVANVVSVNVVTMPAINVTAAGGLTNAELRASAVTVALDAASLAALESVTVTVGNVTIGSSVSISNFPSTQTISGTVTANLASAVTINSAGSNYSNRVVSKSDLKFQAMAGAVQNTKFEDTYTIFPLKITGESQGANLAVDLRTSFNATDISAIGNDGDPSFPTAFVRTRVVGGTVTVGNSVTIGSLPTISGTVTANLGAYQGWSVITKGSVVVTGNSGLINMTDVPNGSIVAVRITNIPSPVVYRLDYRDAGNSTGSTITLNNSFATGSATTFGTSGNYQFRKTGNLDYARFAYDSGSSGGVLSYELYSVADIYYGIERPISGTVTIGSLPTLAPQLPRVTFIDGSGTVTTANSAITVFASSTTRSYLLVQVTTGSAFVNVGATATTVNGINLTAGQGYAWETTIPQGLVSLISTTTSSRWVAKEA